MIQFFVGIFQKACSPAHYQTLKNKTFGQGFGYLTLLFLLVTIVQAISAALWLQDKEPVAERYIETFKTQIVDIYPQGLEVYVNNGELSINKPTPYFVEFPAAWKEALEEDGEFPFQRLIAFDPAGAAERFEGYKSLILFTKTSLVVPDKNGGFRIFPIQSDEPMVFNEQVFNTLMAEALPYLDGWKSLARGLMVALLIGWPILGTIFGLVFYLLYLLVGAVLVLIVSKLFSGTAPYSRIYVVSMFTLTLPLLVELGLMLAGVDRMRFLFTIVYVAWSTIVLSRIQRDS